MCSLATGIFGHALMFANVNRPLWPHTQVSLAAYTGLFGRIHRPLWPRTQASLAAYTGLFGRIHRSLWPHTQVSVHTEHHVSLQTQQTLSSCSALRRNASRLPSSSFSSSRTSPSCPLRDRTLCAQPAMLLSRRCRTCSKRTHSVVREHIL
jgi:hypothetical protein